MVTSLDIASYKAYPDLAMFPRVRNITLSAEERDRFEGVASSLDGLNQEDANKNPWEDPFSEVEQEEIDMARMLLEKKDNIRSLDLGILDSTSMVPFLQHLGSNLVEFAYGINTRAVDRRPHDMQHDEDRPNELELIPLLSQAVDLDAYGHPSYFARSLLILPTLRSLTLGSRSSSKQSAYAPQIHPSWMSLPFRFAATLTSLSLRLEHLDQSALDFASLFSATLTSLTLAGYEINFNDETISSNQAPASFPRLRHLQLETYKDGASPSFFLKRLLPTSVPNLQVLRWRDGSHEVARESEDTRPTHTAWLVSILNIIKGYSIHSKFSRLQQLDFETTEEENLSEEIFGELKRLEEWGISTSVSWISPASDRPARPVYSEEEEDFDPGYGSYDDDFY